MEEDLTVIVGVMISVKTVEIVAVIEKSLANPKLSLIKIRKFIQYMKCRVQQEEAVKTVVEEDLTATAGVMDCVRIVGIVAVTWQTFVETF